MRNSVIRELVINTLSKVKKILSTESIIDDIVIPRYHPWVVSYVNLSCGYVGCGICASIPKGMAILKKWDEAIELVRGIRRGLNAYDVVEKFSSLSLGNDELQVFVNAISISVLNALSHRLMNPKELANLGFHAVGTSIGGLLLGHRMGMYLRHLVRSDDVVTVVGYAYWMYPYLVGRVRKVRCLELMDRELFRVYTLSGEKPRVDILNDAASALEDADVAIITGMTIPNETLTDILKYCKSARLKVMYGPSSSFYPEELFRSLGIDILLAMRIPNDKDTKLHVLDSRGLHPYENPYTELIICSLDHQVSLPKET